MAKRKRLESNDPADTIRRTKIPNTAQALHTLLAHAQSAEKTTVQAARDVLVKWVQIDPAWMIQRLTERDLKSQAVLLAAFIQAKQGERPEVVSALKEQLRACDDVTFGSTLAPVTEQISSLIAFALADDLIQHEHSFQRVVAGRLLERRPARQALRRLALLVRDSEIPVRKAAINAIATLDTSLAASLLLAAKQDVDSTVREATVNAIQQISFPRLRGQLDDANKSTGSNAHRSNSTLPAPQRYLSILLTEAKDSTAARVAVREAVENALKTTLKTARGTTLQVYGVVGDERCHVVRALRQFGAIEPTIIADHLETRHVFLNVGMGRLYLPRAKSFYTDETTMVLATPTPVQHSYGVVLAAVERALGVVPVGKIGCVTIDTTRASVSPLAISPRELRKIGVDSGVEFFRGTVVRRVDIVDQNSGNIGNVVSGFVFARHEVFSPQVVELGRPTHANTGDKAANELVRPARTSARGKNGVAGDRLVLVVVLDREITSHNADSLSNAIQRAVGGPVYGKMVQLENAKPQDAINCTALLYRACLSENCSPHDFVDLGLDYVGHTAFRVFVHRSLRS